jgi:FAD/FMN-containing dehydrogenase
VGQTKNIRVVVKSTGHSITGRSIGAASLSIWTHYLRGNSYISDFTPMSCKAGKGMQAARSAVGHTVIDVMRAVAKHNAVAITGANLSVGIVGWLTGGGHGPLTQTYGMGVDQLLES